MHPEEHRSSPKKYVPDGLIDSQDGPMDGDHADWGGHPAFVVRIQAHKTKTGKNNAQVASDLGVSQSYLQAVLYRQKTPGLEFLIDAAAMLNCSPQEFSNHPGLTAILKREALDPILLRAIITSVETVLERSCKRLDPEKKGLLVVLIYEKALRSETTCPSKDRIESWLDVAM